MARRSEGLTRTYNRFHDPAEHDPDILKLRELHDAMDRAVLDAYGWMDLQPKCALLLDYEEHDEPEDDGGKRRPKKKPWRYRWPDADRDEVLARLLALNVERGEGATRPSGGRRGLERDDSAGETNRPTAGAGRLFD